MRWAAERPASAAASAAALATLAAAALGAFPALAPLDAGDFVAAATTLGVPHATGFPVYVAAAHAALDAIPTGSGAFRISVLSALCSAIAAAAVTWTAVRAARLRAGAIAVALCTAAAFARVDTLVLHARVPEVYALNLAAVAAALVCIERLLATQDARWRAMLALVAGLGLANHALFRLWLPVLVLAAVTPHQWRQLRDAKLRAFLKPWPPLLPLGSLAVAGYAYLYAAALRDPPHNWGDPSTPARLWAHITARDIRIAFADDMIPGAYALQVHIGTLAEQLYNGLGLHTLLAVLGLGVLLLRDRALAVRFLPLVALEAAYSVAINPMGLRDFQNGQLCALATAAAAGVALGALADLLAQGRSVAATRAIVIATAVAALAPFALATGPHVAHSATDWSADDIMAIHTGLAAPESITVTGSDTTTAAALYARVAVDARPDSAFVGRHTLSDGASAHREALRSPVPWAPDAVRDAWAEHGTGAGGTRERDLLEHARSSGRTVYWEGTGNGDDLPRQFSLRHTWPIGTATGSTAHECDSGSLGYCIEGLDVTFGAPARAAAGADDYFYGRWIARQWGYRGARAFRAGDFASSGMWFSRAQQRAPDNPAWTTGLALALANSGRLEEGLAVQEIALTLNPLSEQAVRNAIAFAEALGDTVSLARFQAHQARLQGR